MPVWKTTGITLKPKGFFSSVSSAVAAVMVYRCKQSTIYSGREPLLPNQLMELLKNKVWGCKAILYVNLKTLMCFYVLKPFSLGSCPRSKEGLTWPWCICLTKGITFPCTHISLLPHITSSLRTCSSMCLWALRDASQFISTKEKQIEHFESKAYWQKIQETIYILKGKPKVWFTKNK